MTLELDKRLLQDDVDQGNVGMVLEHAADSHLSDEDLKRVLADALITRAEQKLIESDAVDKSWGEKGKGSFEKRRATNLIELAKQILSL